MFQEIHYWERLMFEIPHYANDVYNKREDLRGLREHVLLVVRDYNRSEPHTCITTAAVCLIRYKGFNHQQCESTLKGLIV